MDNTLIQKAKEIIEKSLYITLATVNENKDPWNSPVFAAFDTQYNFYWKSGKDSVHSKNINSNGKVFIVIYDTNSPWGTGTGVYIQANAMELTSENEINTALLLLDKRSPKKTRDADEFKDDRPRRVYKTIPEKVWINVDGEIDGYIVDKRIEIQLR